MANFKVGVILTATNAKFRKGMAAARKAAGKAFSGIKKDSKSTQKELDRTGESAKNLGGILKSAKLQLLGLLGAAGLQQFTSRVIAAADAWKTYSARLGLATDNADELATAERELLRISKGTRTDLKDNIALYTRLAASRKELNLGQEQLLELTESVAQAFQLSGANQAETASGVTQLSQALASGVLRGDEFNSIMENGGRISKALTDSLGVTKGELWEMAKAGELTATTVVQALQSQADVISAEFVQLPLTVEGAVTNMVTSWERYIAKADQGAGATAALADGINSLAENFDEVARVATTVGAVIVAAFAVKGAKAVRAYVVELRIATGAMAANEAATKAAAATYGKLGSAIKGLGWAAAIAGVIDITQRVIQLRREAKETAEQVRTNFDEIANGTGTVELYAMAVASGAENMEEFSKQVKNGTLTIDEATGSWVAGGKVLDALGLNAHLAATGLKAVSDEFNTPVEVKNGFFSQMSEELTTLATDGIPAFVTKLAQLRESNLLTDGHVDALRLRLVELQQQIKKTGGEIKVTIKKETVEGVTQFTDGLSGIAPAAESAAGATGELAKETKKAGDATGDAVDITNLSVNEYVAHRKATRDAAAAQTEHGEATEQAAAKVAGASSVMAQMVDWVNGLKDGLSALSPAAVEAFEFSISDGASKALDPATALKNKVGELGDELLRLRTLTFEHAGNPFAQWFLDTAKAAAEVEQAFYKEAQSAEALIGRLGDVSAGHVGLVEQTKQALSGFQLLDGARLSKLQAEVDRVAAATDRMSNAADNALKSYQDLVDRQAGNELAIEQREMTAALADLDKQLKEARNSGNVELVSQLEKASNLARKYHEEEIRLLQEKMAAEEKLATVRERSVTLPGAGSTGPSQAAGGATGLIPTLPAQYQTPVEEIARGVGLAFKESLGSLMKADGASQAAPRMVNVRLDAGNGTYSDVLTKEGEENQLIDLLSQYKRVAL